VRALLAIAMLSMLLCCKEAVAVHVPGSQRKIISIDWPCILIESRMYAGARYIFKIGSAKPVTKPGVSPYIIECWFISNKSDDGDLYYSALSSPRLEFINVVILYQDRSKDRNGLSRENGVPKLPCYRLILLEFSDEHSLTHYRVFRTLEYSVYSRPCIECGSASNIPHRAGYLEICAVISVCKRACWDQVGGYPGALSSDQKITIYLIGFLGGDGVSVRCISANLRCIRSSFGQIKTGCHGLGLLSHDPLLRLAGGVQLPHRLGLRSGGRGVVARGTEQILHVTRLDASIPAQSVGCAPKRESKDSEGERREPGHYAQQSWRHRRRPNAI
jgi:hypothetical protein